MYSVIMPGILWYCHVPHSLILSCTVLLCQGYCGVVMYHTVLFYHVQCYYARDIVELSCTTQSYFIMYSVIMPGILWYCHVPHSLILSCTVLLCQEYCGVVMYHAERGISSGSALFTETISIFKYKSFGNYNLGPNNIHV